MEIVTTTQVYGVKLYVLMGAINVINGFSGNSFFGSEKEIEVKENTLQLVKTLLNFAKIN